MDIYIASKVEFAEKNFSITNVETIERDHHGNIHYFENSYIGEVFDSHLVRMWGIQRDFTEKRRLQEQLRASENRYRNLVEQANDLVILLNERCEFIFANKRFFELTQYVANEIFGKPISILVAADEAGTIMRQVQEQLDSQDQNLRYTIKLLTKFNEEHIVDFSMTTLSDANKMAGHSSNRERCYRRAIG